MHGSPQSSERFTVSPRRYVQLAHVALAALTLIVFTGAAVRLTASGLGCPDWPRCYGKPYPPLDTHSVIEFGNRVLSGLVTLAVLAAAIGAVRRRPYRRDLVRISLLLPLGAFAQAALGAFTVKSELQYGWVMAHFGLSMVMMIAAVWLVWRARREPGAAPPTNERVVVWSVRAFAAIALVTLASGMFATAAGPHAGGEPGQSERFEPRGGYSLEWVVQRHGRVGDVVGIAAVALWVLLWRRGAPRRLRRWSTALVALVGLQGLVGALQWRYELPAELVWVHVVLATLTWIAALWCVLLTGRSAPKRPAAVGDRAKNGRAPSREEVAESLVEQV